MKTKPSDSPSQLSLLEAEATGESQGSLTTNSTRHEKAQPSQSRSLEPRASSPSSQRTIELRRSGPFMELDGQKIPIELSRSRRRTVGMTILEGRIKVTAPNWVPLTEIANILDYKSRWLTNRLKEWQVRQANKLEPKDRWAHGATVQFLGQPCVLQLQPHLEEVLWDAKAAALLVPSAGDPNHEQVRDRVHGFMQAQAKDILKERLDALSEKSGRGYSRFSITHARTRWGSCTQDGHIRLNWRLIQFSLQVIDYVVAHELAHLKAMDHSRSFWDEVATILPDYKAGQQGLKGVTFESVS
ncbi:MAG: M48 family metallopeptidase [Burkholderiaceae bacterium]